MNCVGTQSCSPILQENRTGSDLHMIQRTNFSHSDFTNSKKSLYSGIKLEPDTEIETSTTMFETSQIGHELHQESLSSDGITPQGTFEHVSTELIPSNFSLNYVPDIWDHNTAQNHMTTMTRFPSQDSTSYSHSNSECSNKPAYILPANCNDSIVYNNMKFCDTDSSQDMSNYENYHFLNDSTLFRKNISRSNSLSIAGSHDLSNISEDECLSSLNFGLNLSPDSLAYDHASNSNLSLWEDISSTSSPKILPRYDEWNLSPTISNSVCFLSTPHAPSRYNEIYPETDDLERIDQPDQILVDGMNKMAVGSKSTFGLNDLIATSNCPSVIGSNVSEDSFKPLRRSGIELENNARDHPFYQNATPQEDGLYHCPWENEPGSNCQHKPEKLKCNYDKCVDSHLKPYRCKIATCKGSNFSSTACLLRHERETHAMHGHGDKPYLCEHEGCERGIPGKGFPRRWNLYDHTKRVHKDIAPNSSLNHENTESGAESNILSSGIPISLNKFAKGRKRVPKSSFPSAFQRVSGPSIIRKPRKPSLIESYRQKQQHLLETVKQLQDPKQIDNITLIQNANNCLDSMMRATQIINSTPNLSQKGG